MPILPAANPPIFGLISALGAPFWEYPGRFSEKHRQSAVFFVLFATPKSFSPGENGFSFPQPLQKGAKNAIIYS
jgi:hypothetical protein